MIEEKQAFVFSFLDPDLSVRHIDIFLRSDLSHAALSPHVDLVEFNGRILKLVSMKKLLEIKLAIQSPRLKDQIDIEFLRNHA